MSAPKAQPDSNAAPANGLGEAREAALKLLKADAFKRAIPILEALVRADPKDAWALHHLGLARWRSSEGEAVSLPLLAEARKLAPKDAALAHNYGSVLGSLGRFDEAEALLRDALTLKPDYPEAWHTLAGLRKFNAGDGDIDAMEALATAGKLSAEDASFICFALGKAYDDAGRHEPAFDMIAQGNRHMGAAFDLDGLEARVEACERVFTAEFFASRKGVGHTAPAPVFVVGSPRSGTTLIESMIAAHPDVAALGESAMIEQMADQMGAAETADRREFARAARACLDHAHKRSSGWFARFVDKTPQHAFHLGLIQLMFPNARVIHTRRHPLDAGASIFFQRFSGGVGWGFDLEHIGRALGLYERMMAHWRAVLPMAILELDYENVVAAPEDASRKLIDFIGLPWDPACLERRDARAVRTASRWQVRQPVTQGSVARWRRYGEARLEPLIAALGGMDAIEAEMAGRGLGEAAAPRANSS